MSQPSRAGSELLSSGSRQASVARSCPGGAQASVDSLAVAAKRRYSLEDSGAVVHADRARIASDTVLLHDLSVGDLGAAQAEADRQLVRHVVRIRIVRGSRVLVDANPTSFAVAGATVELRARNGRDLGRLEVSLQDVVGFIKLVHKFTGADALVRGQRGQVQTSLFAAVRVGLPGSGCVTIGGSGYAVRSFGEAGFAGDALTVWVMHVA